MAGELSWRVPSLPLADKAIELFADRARRARPDFIVTDDNAATVARDLPSPRRGAAGDRTGGRTGAGAVVGRDPREPARPVQAVDRRCAHRGAPPADLARLGGLVTRPADRTRAGACFVGWRHSWAASTSTAAQSVCGGGDVERYQVLDQLALLVDKSLVVADESGKPNALPAVGDGAPIRAGKAWRVRRGRRRAHASPRPLHGDGRRARRAGRQ